MPRSAAFHALFLSMSVLALSACGSEAASTPKTAAPMPPIEEMDAAMAQPAPQPLSASDTLTPILPPADSVTAPSSGASVAQAASSVAPAVAASTGGASMEERIARLEQSVGSLRADYERIMPAFASLNTTNERIQALLDQIERDTGHRPVVDAATAPAEGAVSKADGGVVPPAGATHAMAPAASVKTAPVAQPPVVSRAADAPAPKVSAPATAPATSGASVTGVRIGEHGSKTRLVLDLTAKTKPDFKYDLDNAEKLLVVDLPATGWSGNVSGKGGVAAPLVAGWNAEKGAGGGSTLAIQLKKNARVLSTQFLPADGQDPARLVVDIAAGG